MKLIVAVDSKWGIGNVDTGIPWSCKEDLSLFRKLTMGHIIVVGVNTARTLPKLNNRTVYVMVDANKKLPLTENWNNDDIHFVYSFDEILKKNLISKKIFIAGGAWLYKKAIEEDFVEEISLSLIPEDHNCNVKFSPHWIQNFAISEREEYDTFTHYTLTKGSNPHDWEYHNLMSRILGMGKMISTRNSDTLRLIGTNMRFDLRKGFPALTTKKMFWRGVVEEFLFFIRGDTDSSYLEEKGVKIWSHNTSRENLDKIGLSKYSKGVMGPMYGFNWRNYGASYKLDYNGRPDIKKYGVDQLQNVIDQIMNTPYSRRILMTSYNPVQLDQCVLPPCHSLMIQFFVEDEGDKCYLDMIVFNRSQDVFLGVPFNIASSALLLTIIAKIAGLIPRELIMTMGDSHIYKDHIESVKTQLSRIPYKSPTLNITKNFRTLDEACSLQVADFELENYKHHPSIRAKMIV